jgi:hypothetical protein
MEKQPMILSLSSDLFLRMADIAAEIVVPESRWYCLGLHVHEPPKKEDRTARYEYARKRKTHKILFVGNF